MIWMRSGGSMQSGESSMTANDPYWPDSAREASAVTRRTNAEKRLISSICPNCGTISRIPPYIKRKFCSHSCSNLFKVSKGNKSYDPKLRMDWRNCMVDASRRNIVFLLTYEQWLEVWQRSGYLDKRGCKKGQYVMARFGDIGPYSLDNVKIVPQEDNHAEMFDLRRSKNA
jgi:hypothetical protein